MWETRLPNAVSALEPGSSGLGSSTGRDHCVVFFDPQEQMGTGELLENPLQNAGGKLVLD